MAEKSPASRLAIAGFVLSLLAIAAVLAAGTGSRLGWWHFRSGFRILKWGAWLGVCGAALSIGGAFLSRPGIGRRGFLIAVAGIVLGAVSFGVPWSGYRMAQHLPRIHDITTDTEHPPQFVAVLPLRKDAPNSTVYGGPEVAAKQHEAYPDIRPIETGLSPGEAYDRALSTARKMCWRLVEGDKAKGRIEAVATTRWFGFKDDVVIRITPEEKSGSRLDIRSTSRVGISDVGTNARRIRAFLKKFRRLSDRG